MKDIKYEEAVRQLEKIVDKMESGELDHSIFFIFLCVKLLFMIIKYKSK